MISREFTGKNEEEVVDKALDTLKLSKDQVKIEKLSKSGFFSFGKKDVVIKISYDEDDSFGNRSLHFVKELLEKMGIEAKIYLIEENDEKIVIEIDSPDSGLIIGKKGKTLEAMQTIVNVIMNKNFKNWTKVMIDSGNYRNRREKSLKSKANMAAERVRKTKKPITLEPMNPFERRVIHMSLKEERNIDTVSEGSGTMKSVKIIYKD